MYKAFFIRCFHSFQRNFVASVMPLAFPVIFLFLFMDATADVDKPSALRLGVIYEQTDEVVIDSLISTRLVDIKELEQAFDGQRINAKNYDGIITSSSDGKTVTFHLRQGYMPWLEVILTAAGEIKENNYIVNKLEVKRNTSEGNDYLAFILPGLFVMILIQIATTSTANLILSDRAEGSFRIISSVSRSIFPMFLSELCFRLLFTVACYFVLMLIANVVADFTLADKLFQFTLVYFLGSAMMIALGYVLGGLLPSQRNGGAIVTLIGLCFWFFSDILFQASQHPVAKPLSLLLAPTYLTDALRQIATGQPGTFTLAFNIAMMSFWLILFSVLAIRFFKFETSDNRM